MRSPCAQDDFQCESNPSVCIPKELVCDDTFDCSDHSDESNCYLRRRKKDGESMAPANLIGLFFICKCYGTLVTNYKMLCLEMLCINIFEALYLSMLYTYFCYLVMDPYTQLHTHKSSK